MIHRRTYRPFSTSPHTSGVRSRLHTSIATEPCRPTACVCAGSFTVVGIPHSSLLIPDWMYTFSAKEKDSETGYSYFGSRYYNSDLSIWLSVDPMADKYPSLSPYVYCADNPVKLVDPNGEEWTDIDGHIILDHSKIKVYIFYDPESFKDQSEQMYHDAVKLYGKDAVAMSNVTTEKEFAQDWKNMLGTDIREVNLNYHGNSQTLTLDYTNNEYVIATGDGKTNKYGNDLLIII